MNINFQYLRAFVEVARYQSFTQAAVALHLTQPAISKAVRELELGLEIRLLERTSRQVRLTEAGVALYDQARSIFALEQVMLEDIKARRGLQRGRLVIGASTTIAAYWLPAHLTQFTQQFPDIEVSMISGNTQTIRDLVLDYQVDIGLVEGPVVDVRLQCHIWRKEILTLIAPVTLPINPDTLAQQYWIVRESGSGTGEVVNQFFLDQGFQPKRRIEVGSNMAAIQMVLAGGGICLTPRIMVQSAIAQGELQEVPLASGALERPLNWLSLKGRPVSLPRQAFEILCRPQSSIP